MSEAGASRRLRKEAFAARLRTYLDTYKNAIIVQVDNVGSNQMQKVRGALRGRAAVLMGKNTLIKKVIREQAQSNPALEALVPLVYGNMGFVFTNDNLKEVRDLITSNKVPAAAKAGSMAPIDVFLPPGPSGLDPGQTSFFQAMNIATKIVKGAIEIVNEVHLIKAGEKVTASHVALLGKLNIMPFHYGFAVSDVYENGTTYAASILDMSESDLLKKFHNGVGRLAALSMAIGHPTAASLPHVIAGGFSKLLAIAAVTDINFKQAEPIKAYLADPSKFAAAAAPAKEASPAKGAAAKNEVEKPKSESESGGDMGFSLFD